MKEATVAWIFENTGRVVGLLLFTLGAVLLLSALGTGVNLFGAGFSPSGRLWPVGLVVGLGLVGLGATIIWRTTAGPLTRLLVTEVGPDQREILDHLGRRGSQPQAAMEEWYVRRCSDQGARIRHSPGSEIYYRLEQLRLLGFVERKVSGECLDQVTGETLPTYTYSLSRRYGPGLRNEQHPPSA